MFLQLGQGPRAKETIPSSQGRLLFWVEDFQIESDYASIDKRRLRCLLKAPEEVIQLSLDLMSLSLSGLSSMDREVAKMSPQSGNCHIVQGWGWEES